MEHAEVVGRRLMPAVDAAGSPVQIGAGYTEDGRTTLLNTAADGIAYLTVPATSDFLALVRQVKDDAAGQR